MQKTPPHMHPSIQDMEDDDRHTYYNDLTFECYEEVELSEAERASARVLIVHPRYSIGAPCSAAYESTAWIFCAQEDLEHHLSTMLVGLTPPLSKRPHLELITRVYDLVKRAEVSKAVAPEVYLSGLIGAINAELLGLISIELVSYAEYQRWDQFGDHGIGPYRLRGA